MIRVLLLSKYPLLNQGIRSLLRDEADLNVVGQETVPDRAVKCVRELRPDVVIMDNGQAAPQLVAEVMRLFREGVVNSVIELDLRSNTLHLYHREDRTAHRVQDLTRAIHTALPHTEALKR